MTADEFITVAKEYGRTYSTPELPGRPPSMGVLISVGGSVMELQYPLLQLQRFTEDWLRLLLDDALRAVTEHSKKEA